MYSGNNVIIAAILVQLMHTLLNFVYLIYLWNGNYNTSFHVIIISITIRLWYRFKVGTHKLINKFFTNL